MEDSLVEEGDCTVGAAAAAALIAVHPAEHSVVVAVGAELRAFDLKENCAISLSDNSSGPPHSDSIRDIAFSSNGELFVSAGDDKLVKIWETDSWICINTVQSEKRVSAICVSNEGRFVTFADKFGVVWVVSLVGENKDKKPVPILGHYCSIITSMKFSPDGQFIATADRDFKIRVTAFPKNPLTGAHEIQSFCLGHTDFVSCLAFVCSPDQNQGFLLSGSGDSTVRLWDCVDGSLLDTFELGEKVKMLETDETEESEISAAVTDICASFDGSLIAVAIQSFNGVMLLSCDFSSKKLSFTKKIQMEKSYIPTNLSLSSERLWTVMGASNSSNNSNNKNKLLLTRIRIISNLKNKDASCQDPICLEDNQVPAGEKLLLELQGSLEASAQEEAFVNVAKSVRASLQNMMIKKQYSVERRETRKRNRNDKKIKS